MSDRSLVARLRKAPETEPGFTLEKLEDALDKGHILLRREGGHRKKRSFAPSTIGYGHGTCARYWHYAFTGEEFEETADPVGVAMMMNGSASHERIQSALEKAGVVVETEKEMLWEDPPIRGFADLIVEIDGERVVVEIKTTGSNAFQYRRSTGKPAIYHLYQILFYMMIENMDKGVLLYEDRDSLQVVPILVKLSDASQEIRDEALNWMRQVYGHWKDGKEVPKRPWTRRNRACRGCPVFEACWDIEQPVGTDELPKFPEVSL